MTLIIESIIPYSPASLQLNTSSTALHHRSFGNACISKVAALGLV
jgi:hypothetical protein